MRDPVRYAGKLCDDCKHDIECDDCSEYMCFPRACPARFENCSQTMEPFIYNVLNIIAERDAQFPWWTHGLTVPEAEAIIMHDQLSRTIQIENTN